MIQERKEKKKNTGKHPSPPHPQDGREVEQKQPIKRSNLNKTKQII